jgi:hypothetical protein
MENVGTWLKIFGGTLPKGTVVVVRDRRFKDQCIEGTIQQYWKQCKSKGDSIYLCYPYTFYTIYGAKKSYDFYIWKKASQIMEIKKIGEEKNGQ